MRRALAALAILAAGAALAGCAGRPSLLAETSVPGASEVRWACHDSLLVVALGGWGVALVESEGGHERAGWRLPEIPSSSAHGLALSAMGETLAVATTDSVRVFATRGLRPLLSVAGNASTLALSGDGGQLLWTDGILGQLVDVGSAAEPWQGTLEAGEGALQWAEPLGRFLVPQGRAVISACEGERPSFSLAEFADVRPWKLALSTTGDMLAVAESTMHVSIWSLPAGQFRRRLLLGGAGRFEKLVLSPDAQLLAMSFGARVRVLWVRSGRAVADWAPHDGADVEGFAFASDGSRLATVGAGGAIRTWAMPAAPGSARRPATPEPKGEGH